MRRPEIEISLAGSDDIASITDIANWAAMNTPANFATEPEPLAMWESAWRTTREMYPWLVAREPGSAGILGFAKASPHRQRAAYNWTAEVTVYVHPDHHGRGVGTLLYKRLLPTLNQQGYATLVAGITLPNPASERLHEAFGFTRCAVFRRVGWKYGRWHDVGFWELHLQPADYVPAAVLPVSNVLF